jgi:uncharacterized protein YijF (DUF1287 family)
MHRRVLLLAALTAGCRPRPEPEPPLPDTPGGKLLGAARRQKTVTRTYDAAYVRLPYPGGDVPRDRGACTDVVIRAARDGLGADLQKLVHEDMARAFRAYPGKWGLTAPDANIDHRRVPNLETYWKRTGAELWRAPAGHGGGFPLPLEPGDIITFKSVWGRPHVAIVSRAQPVTTIVHNIGAGVREELLAFQLTLEAHGHYRWPQT